MLWIMIEYLHHFLLKLQTKMLGENFVNIIENPLLQVSISFTSVLTVLLLIYVLYQQNKILESSKKSENESKNSGSEARLSVNEAKKDFDKNNAFQFIRQRRSIFPKDYEGTELLKVTGNESHINDHQALIYESSESFGLIFQHLI